MIKFSLIAFCIAASIAASGDCKASMNPMGLEDLKARCSRLLKHDTMMTEEDYVDTVEKISHIDYFKVDKYGRAPSEFIHHGWKQLPQQDRESAMISLAQKVPTSFNIWSYVIYQVYRYMCNETAECVRPTKANGKFLLLVNEYYRGYGYWAEDNRVKYYEGTLCWHLFDTETERRYGRM